jgi:hypothetical protein
MALAPVGTREWDIGDVMRTTAKFKVSGVLTDPTTLQFKFKTPAGVSTTYTYGTSVQVVKDETGVYHVDLPLSEDGDWKYRWVSTGTAAGAAERRVYVKSSEF